MSEFTNMPLQDFHPYVLLRAIPVNGLDLLITLLLCYKV